MQGGATRRLITDKQSSLLVHTEQSTGTAGVIGVDRGHVSRARVSGTVCHGAIIKMV